MGFFGNLEKKYDDFRYDQLKKKKKNLAYLKAKAELIQKESKYKAVINESKKSNIEGFNNRMDAFNGAIMGKPSENKKEKKPGDGIDKWF